MTSKAVSFLVAAFLVIAAAAPSVSAASFGEPTDDGYTYMASMGGFWNPDNTYVGCYGYAATGEYDGFAYMKWDISSVAQGVTYDVTSASLTLTFDLDQTWTTSDSALYPLEFVGLDKDWSEASSFASLPVPGSVVYGSGSYAGNPVAGQDFTWTIDLDPTAFTGYFNSAVAGGELNLVGRSMMPMVDMSNMKRYLWSSNQNGDISGAILNVEYAAVPEPGALLALSAGLVGLLPRLKRR